MTPAHAVLATTAFVRILLLYAPLLLVGFAAGVIRIAAQRSSPFPGRRRFLQAAWVLVLLAGVPLWLVLAALLNLW